MLLNLTLNPPDFFGEDSNIVEFKRDEAWDMLAMFWSDTVCDFISLSKKISDLAHESGIKKAVIDVPAYSVSILETELLLRGIIPVHYYSGQFVETKSEVLLENLYNILERQTDGDYDKTEVISADNVEVPSASEKFDDAVEPELPVEVNGEPAVQEGFDETIETAVASENMADESKKSFKIQRTQTFGHNVNLHFNPTLKDRV